MLRFKKNKIRDYIIFVFIILFFTTLIIIKFDSNKKEKNKQVQLKKDFIEREFKGVVIDYIVVSRGLNIEIDDDYIILGNEGMLLRNEISINDSIVKTKGDNCFYLYKRNYNNLIYDTVIVRCGNVPHGTGR